MRKILAFTLAETLIVMGIIGIVSALTLPNLNSSTGEKEKVAKVKKIYSNLNDALGRAQAVYGPYREWLSLDDNHDAQVTRFGERLTEFMKVSKTCALGSGCWSTSKFLLMDGTKKYDNYSDKISGYKIILADGTALAISIPSAAAKFVWFFVDIDGPNKGKTQSGSDIFDFTLSPATNYEIIPSKSPENWTGNIRDFYETAWVIYNENLDYLKCADELNWQTKTSCK